jgi:hypothetical protein
MKTHLWPLLLCTVLTVSALPAQTVGVSNLGGTPLGNVYRAANSFVGSGFTTDSTFAQYTLSEVIIPLDGTTGITDFTVSLYTNSGTNKPGTLLATLAGPSSPLAGQNSFINDGVTLEANTSYWVTWGFTNGGGGFYLAPQMASNVGTGAWTVTNFGTYSSNAGASWDLGGAGYPYQFSVAATNAIPEPSTYAMIFGAGALGLAAWRRRART